MNRENLDKLKKDLNTLREDLSHCHCKYFAECDGCVLEEYDRGISECKFDVFEAFIEEEVEQ